MIIESFLDIKLIENPGAIIELSCWNEIEHKILGVKQVESLDSKSVIVFPLAWQW